MRLPIQLQTSAASLVSSATKCFKDLATIENRKAAAKRAAPCGRLLAALVATLAAPTATGFQTQSADAAPSTVAVPAPKATLFDNVRVVPRQHLWPRFEVVI